MAEISQQDTGEQTVGTAGTAPEPGALEGAESWSVDDLIAAAALAGTTDDDDPDPSADDDAEDGSDFSTSDEGEDEEAGDESDDEDTEGDEDDDAPAQGDPWAEGGAMFKYAGMVAATPQRINEVPGKVRGEVLQKVLAAAYMRGRSEAAQQFETVEQERSFVAEYDNLRVTDPEGFLQWSEEHPQDAARYWQSRERASTQGTQTPSRGGSRAPEQRQSQQQAPDQQVAQDAQYEIGRLGKVRNLEARGAVIGRIQRGEFLQTPEGVRALREAIDEAMQAAVPAESKPERDPNGPAARRQEAAVRRKSYARVEMAGGGASAGNPNPIANVNEVGDLLAMAIDQS